MTQTVTNKSAPPIRPRAKLARQTRRIVNVRLLVLSLLILVVAGVLGYFWHGYQSQRVAGMLLDRAESLEREEKWAEASNYLTRYLQVEPADAAARLRLVDAVEKSSAAGPGKRRLASLLYQTLGASPEREDLRLKLAQTLLDLRDFSSAQKQAELLYQSKDQSTLVASRRIAALSLASKAEPGGLTSIATAAQALEAALKDNPGDVTVASLTAALYRQYSTEVGAQATTANADRVMDELVNADKQNIEALIARHKYRLQYSPSQARADLDAALELNPDHIEALVLDIQSGLGSGDQARVLAAQQSAQRLIELSPEEPRGYISLAQLESGQGHTDRAVELLRSGRKKLATENLDFDYLYAGLLLDLSKSSEARAIATDFSKQVDRWLPELPRASRAKLENMNRLIQARLAISDGEADKATRELSKIIASVGDTSNVNEAFEALIAHDLLAVLATQQQRPDLAASHWGAIAELQPGFRQAALKAGIANLESGRVNEALALLRTYMKQPDALPEANLTLVQARLQEQMARPVAERNWTDFLAALEQAKAKLPNRWEWQLAEIVYLQSQPEQESKQPIAGILAKLETTFPDDITLCERLLVFYQQTGRPKDAERMLKRYGEMQPGSTRGVILNATYLASNKQIPEAIQYLVDAAAKAPAAEKRELTLAQIKLMAATNQLSEAQELVSKTLVESPTDAQILTIGLEIALLRKQYDTALKLENALANASGVDNFEFRFLRARRLVAQFGELTQAERAELEQLVGSLRADRPNWFPVLGLTGQVAEAQGNHQAAIDALRAARAAGDRRPETLELLVRVLYADGQFDEATRYLSQVQSDESSTGRYESMAIFAAVKRNQLDEARGLAQHAVDRGSKDPIHFIWLANLMKLAGDQQGAESTFRKALQQFPKDARVWNGVFAHFMQSGQADRARKTLERWIEAVPMSEFDKCMVLAQGNESLGDQKTAQEFYRKAINEQPEHLNAKFLLAKSLATTDSAAARRELDFVLQKDPAHPDARRMQATLLAATGDANDWSRAFELLNQGAKDAAGNGSIDDNRLRAILLARKGKDREERIANYESARQVLLGNLERSNDESNNIDRMLLAGIYEQKAKLGEGTKAIQAARDMWRPVVDQPDVTADQLLSYIQMLLRYVAPLDIVKGDEENAETMKEVFADDARLRIDALEKLMAKEPRAEITSVPMALRMKLLSLQGESPAALQLLNEFVDRKQPEARPAADRARLYLQAGNLCASISEFKAAEDWYRRVEEIAPNSYVLVAQSLLQQGKPNEAVKRCLQAAAAKPSPDTALVLAQILSSGKKVDPELDRQAFRVINEALDDDRGNVDLLMSTAVLHVMRNESDEAIRLFRRVVEIQPNHILALNNLATMLSEQQDSLNEAQHFIERAIASAGRDPSLLDTLGTILLRSQQFKPAIAALEEATAGTASDPRYYFHLAAAYDGDNRTAEAQRALQTAIKLGLDRAILTSGDRELLASLKQDLLTANYQD